MATDRDESEGTALDPFITVTELGTILGCGRSKAAALVASGIVPSFPSPEPRGHRLIHRAEAIEFRDHGRTRRWQGTEARPGVADVDWRALFEGLGEAFERAAPRDRSRG